jgi:hypothetical protein
MLALLPSDNPAVRLHVLCREARECLREQIRDAVVQLQTTELMLKLEDAS